jgi:hypothetical protein
MDVAKVKNGLLGLAARTRDTLWHAMQGVRDSVSLSGATSCFARFGLWLRLTAARYSSGLSSPDQGERP